MIQRIQSLYLLFVVAMMALTMTTTLASFELVSAAQTDLPELIEFKAFGIQDAAGTTPRTMYLGLLSALIAAMALVTIFCFKNRLLQVRLCAMQMVLLIGAMGYSAYYILSLKSAIAGADAYATHISFANAAPLAALIVARLAMKAILRDEYLVRSADRIR